MENKEEEIIKSWKINAKAWNRAIKQGEIQTRLAATNQSIIEAIVEQSPNSVLDIGCGEGWLVRDLEQRGISCTGIDASLELIQIASQDGVGKFLNIAYVDLKHSNFVQKFDLCVCNFSLLGKHSCEQVFDAIPKLLNRNGRFIIQTLHPESLPISHLKEEGWKKGSWNGFNEEFSDPHSWYFRTMEGWKKLFQKHSLDLLEIRDILNPFSTAFASVIFIAKLEDVNS